MSRQQDGPATYKMSKNQRGAGLREHVGSLILDILGVRCQPVRHSNGDVESQGNLEAWG